MPEKKRVTGLGRGLSALLEEVGAPSAAAPGALPTMLPVASIDPNSAQPRRQFDRESLDDLTASVKARGIVQPILVRPVADGRYQIVAGERRWRAAQAAQLHDIPVVVRELDDAAAFEIALIENIQRADLNPVEEAEGFARLMRDFGHTQEALARIVGKARSHVANILRLLDLPESIRAMLRDRSLSMGHARALITARDPVTLAQRVVAEGLSVRQTEALAAALAPRRAARRAPAAADANLADLEATLADSLGMPVRLAATPDGAGALTVRYSSLDQLDRLCALLGRPG